MPSPTVAIIDIGSNSIKLLVASKKTDGTIEEIFQSTEETRIGHGIGIKNPILRENSMRRALTSVRILLSKSKDYNAVTTDIIATSAVRDSSNHQEFAQRIKEETGISLRILSGKTEAQLIGQGVRCDPAIRNLKNFYLFDLGGGSLECISFENSLQMQKKSLPLGSVRMTEKWIKKPESPFSKKNAMDIGENVARELKSSGFTISANSNAPAILTGGSATNVRFLLSDDQLNPSAIIPLTKLEELLEKIAPLNLEERRKINGLPAERADIFPAALITLITISLMGNFDRFRHSFYNLRYGIASELLQKLEG